MFIDFKVKFHPLNLKQALIKSFFSPWLVWTCKNLFCLWVSPTVSVSPLSSPSTCLFSCQSPLSHCLCQSAVSLFSDPGPLITLFWARFSLSAILHFYLYPPLLSRPLRFTPTLLGLVLVMISVNEKTLFCFFFFLHFQTVMQHFSERKGFNSGGASLPVPAFCLSSLVLHLANDGTWICYIFHKSCSYPTISAYKRGECDISRLYFNIIVGSYKIQCTQISHIIMTRRSK